MRGREDRASERENRKRLRKREDKGLRIERRAGCVNKLNIVAHKGLVQQTIGLGFICMRPQCFSNNGHEQTNPDLGFSQVVL